MKELRITLRLAEWELIPELNHPTERSITFRWLFIDMYYLKKKKK